MCQEARSPSSADRVRLVQALWARAHHREKGLLKGSSQIYKKKFVKNLESASTTGLLTRRPSDRMSLLVILCNRNDYLVGLGLQAGTGRS